MKKQRGSWRRLTLPTTTFPNSGWCASNFSQRANVSTCGYQKPCWTRSKQPPQRRVCPINDLSDKRSKPPFKGGAVAYNKKGCRLLAIQLRLSPPGSAGFHQFGRRFRHGGGRGVGLAGAGELDERLHQSRDAGEALLFVVPIAQIDEPLVGAQPQGPGVLLDQLDEPRRVGETVAAQCDDRALGARLDPLDPGVAAVALDCDDL